MRASAVRHGPPAGCAEPQLLRPIEPERRVGGGDDDPAAARCARMMAASAAWAAASSAVVGSSSSQSGRSATRRRASATRRLCPAESRRAGKSITWARPSAERRALRVARGIAAEHRSREREVLAGRQRALHAVGVAEIVRLLADRALGVAALERKAAGLERQKAGKRAQEPRFPRAVRPGHDQGHARAATNESPAMSRRPPRSIVKSQALRRMLPPGAFGAERLVRALVPASLAQQLKKRQPAIHRDYPLKPCRNVRAF